MSNIGVLSVDFAEKENCCGGDKYGVYQNAKRFLIDFVMQKISENHSGAGKWQCAKQAFADFRIPHIAAYSPNS